MCDAPFADKPVTKAAWVLISAHLAASAAASGNEYVISTIAGGLAPVTPVAAHKAFIGAIAGMAVDSVGNIYLSTNLSCVFRIDPAGTLTRFAGTCRSGYSGDGGPATSAQLSSPFSIAADREGNLYIAGIGKLRLRKVSVGGAITTVAGVEDQGPPGKPLFHLAVDTHGAIYAAESRQGGNGWRVRRISPSGAFSTVAGSDLGTFADQKTAINSGLYYPGDVALDSAGSLYIAERSNLADSYHGRIRKVLGSGRIITVAGGAGSPGMADGGPATKAAIWSDCHLAVDATGNLYISEHESHRVRKVSEKGIITTIAGTGSAGFGGDGGPAARAQLNYPEGIALDSAGNLFIADYLNRRVRKVAIDGTISTVAGNGNAGSGGNGGLAVNVALGGPIGLAVDSVGNIYIHENEWGQVRKVSPSGIISAVANVQDTRSIAVDRSDTLYFATSSSIVRLSAEGVAETIAGSSYSGYSGDGGPALEARFARLSGMAMDRAGRIYVSDIAAHAVRMLTPVQGPKEDTSDLKVRLRSATGSNRFQIGEEIPLQVVLSSGTPNRYLQPCNLFSESDFATPECRFFNHWSFSIEPDRGWVDLTQEFPSGERGGSHVSVADSNPDLSAPPVTFSYVLTHRFRFDAPGEYNVRLAMDVGFDDETTRRGPVQSAGVRPHTVSVKPEIVLRIVPAEPQWQAETIRKGVEAFTAPVVQAANPPSPEFRQNQEARKALCNLGTPEAARAFARLLVRDGANRQEEEGCLQHTASPAEAIEEMERVLVDPDTAVNAGFFRVLVMLLGQEESRKASLPLLSQRYVDAEREKLFAALPQKRGPAQVSSLLTVLANPGRIAGNTYVGGYDKPFDPPVIASLVANFDRLPVQQQEWVLDDAWYLVRSPLMLPVVRRRAMAGDGPALLCWLGLDPPAAIAFMREELVQPVPRFSSFYLRLPDKSLPAQEAQIAAHFVALTDERDLARAATLLHRYATSAVLGQVLPFIDAHLAAWSPAVQFPVLAFLLKVSPEDAAPRLQRALGEGRRSPYYPGTFFTDIGFLQASPVLERMAFAEIDNGSSRFAASAVEYLRKHGSPGVKPLLWERLDNWQRRYAASGAGERFNRRASTQDDYSLTAEGDRLVYALVSAQGWVLLPEETGRLEALLGKEMVSQLSCHFNCGAAIAIDASSLHTYHIYSHANQKFDRKLSPMEYLNSAERLHYSINQYDCVDLTALKEKMLQFPADSTFGFTYEFTAKDRKEIEEIMAFLSSHGYRVQDPLPPDPR